MNRNTRSEKESMSPMQKQAVLVCVICVLAALLTASITLTLLKKKAAGPADSAASTETPADSGSAGENLSGHYQIDNTSSALLAETVTQARSIRTVPSFWAIPTPFACTTTA